MICNTLTRKQVKEAKYLKIDNFNAIYVIKRK